MAGETATVAVETTPQAPAAPAAPAKEWSRERPDSFAAFDAQETDRALGRAPAAPAKPAEAAPTGDDAPATDSAGQPLKGPDGKFISKRAQEQERRTREAIDRATAGTRTENERLKRRIAELEALEARTGQPPAQPAAQPAQPAQPAEDKEPVLDDFLDQPDPYLAYARAQARWEVRQELKTRDQATEQRTAQERAHQSVMDRVTAHTQREAKLKETVPDYDTKTQAVREQLDVRSPLTLAVLESPVSERLILHLAEHPEDFDRIGRLPLPLALVAIGKLEAKFDTTETTKTETTAASPAAPTAPPKKTVSSAPEPPTTLGTRPAEPANVSHTAVARKDFRAFDEEETRKDLAKRRRA